MVKRATVVEPAKTESYIENQDTESKTEQKPLEDEEEEEEENESEESLFDEEEDKSLEEDERDEEENEEEEETQKPKKRRCQRRRKIRQICYESDDDEEEHDDEEELVIGEDEEDYEDEETESDELSFTSSVLSAITFQWEDKVYEFEELCDPRPGQDVYKIDYTEPVLTDDIGKARYLHMCQVLSATPMIRFLHALETNEVDLSYREIDSKNIRAVCAALETNAFVERLILKFNKLVKVDCHFIGLMLYYNEIITFLDLTGCRIGPEGVEELIKSLLQNEVLTELNLSKCYIKDEGMKLLFHVLIRNNSIQKLNLSYNKLAEESAEVLGQALKVNKCLTDLNLRYNSFFEPTALKTFFRGMTANESITHLNLAWNGMSGEDVGSYLKNFLRRNQTIQYLDLSDNRFEGPAVSEIKKGLTKSQSLNTIKLGKNPISSDDLNPLLSAAKACSSLKVLDLDDLWVNKSFVKNLKKIQAERELEVNFAGMFGDYEVYGPDYPKVILQRAQYEAMKPKKKKKKRDFGHLMWTLGDEPMTEEEFMTRVKKFKAKINKELYPELMKQFMIPKIRLIDVVAMRDKYLSIFPDSTPPPPPKKKDKNDTQGEVEVAQVIEEPKVETKGALQEEEDVPTSEFEEESEEEEFVLPIMYEENLDKEEDGVVQTVAEEDEEEEKELEEK